MIRKYYIYGWFCDLSNWELNVGIQRFSLTIFAHFFSDGFIEIGIDLPWEPVNYWLERHQFKWFYWQPDTSLPWKWQRPEDFESKGIPF